MDENMVVKENTVRKNVVQSAKKPAVLIRKK
jgi:hypothetical protein